MRVDTNAAREHGAMLGSGIAGDDLTPRDMQNSVDFISALADEIDSLREEQAKWQPLLEASRGAVGSLHRTPAWAWSVHLHELERALKPFED